MKENKVCLDCRDSCRELTSTPDIKEWSIVVVMSIDHFLASFTLPTNNFLFPKELTEVSYEIFPGPRPFPTPPRDRSSVYRRKAFSAGGSEKRKKGRNLTGQKKNQRYKTETGMWKKGHRGLTLYILVLYILLYTMSPADTDERSLSRRKRYVVFPEGSSFSIALCMTIHTLTPDNIFTEGLNWGISYDLPNESKPSLDPLLEIRRQDRRPGDSIKHRHPALLETDQWILNGNSDSIRYGNLNKGTYGNNAVDNFKKNYKNIEPIGKSKIGKIHYRKSDYDYFKRRHRRELYNKLEVIIDAMGYNGRTCILRALCEAAQALMPKGNTLLEEMMRIVFSMPLKRAVLSHEPKEHHIYTEAHRAGFESASCESRFSGCSFSLIDMALGKYNSKYHEYNTDTESNSLNVHQATDNPVGNSLMIYNMK
ncbi:Protein of unknown function [Cotesia congregata]|uniref:Uncharacterized protein n=1 Tax=Cotesia congregata TaxID=51543 RepID=A0A8J2MQX8_COTCN|nr:Protein of unknown function [Cotesia congregata]